MSKRIKKCPKCRFTGLSVIEVHDENGYTDFGEVALDHRGDLIPPSVFWFSAGDTTAVQLQCGNCEHVWTPRGKPSVSNEESSAVSS